MQKLSQLMKCTMICLCTSWMATVLQGQGGRAALPDTLPNNPLKGDIRVHDPVMIKEKDTYYIFHTGRGISVKTSTDKITWKKAGSIFKPGQFPAWHKQDIPEQDGSLWAPDIHFDKGVYWLYYSVSAWMNFNSSIGLVTNTTLDSTSPDYKWVDRGQVIGFKNGGEKVNVIDPNIYMDKSGRKWLLYGSYQAGLRMVELNPKTGMLLEDTNPKLIALTTSLGEGVFLLKDADYYYIFASRGRCCAGKESTYQIVMGRSESIEGPYLTKDNKSWQENNYSLLLAGDSTEPGRGHNGFFTEGDTTFIVYHAYTMAANGTSLLNIKPLYMDADGWPSITPTGKLFRRKAY